MKRFWGLWDTQGKCWLGNEQGPWQKENKTLAKVAATVASEQLGHLIRPVLLPPGPFKYKDEVPTKMTPEEALKKIEGKI